MPIKIKKIQADFFAEFPFHRAGDQVQDDFCGGADDCPVQVSAHHMAFRVSGGKVGVQIRRSVFGGEGSRQGNDFIGAFKRVGVILLCLRVKHTYRESVDCAKTADLSQPDSFLLGESQKLFADFLTRIEPDEKSGVKFPIFHVRSSFSSPSGDNTFVEERQPPFFGTNDGYADSHIFLISVIIQETSRL